MEIEDYKKMRVRLISMVLATDMSNHFADIAKFKSRASSDDFEPHNNDKIFCMSMVLHLADVSHSGKKWELCNAWTEMLFIEFFN
jgi:hypothetical protein